VGPSRHEAARERCFAWDSLVLAEAGKGGGVAAAGVGGAEENSDGAAHLCSGKDFVGSTCGRSAGASFSSALGLQLLGGQRSGNLAGVLYLRDSDRGDLLLGSLLCSGGDVLLLLGALLRGLCRRTYRQYEAKGQCCK
jgi:hypothetical protein